MKLQRAYNNILVTGGAGFIGSAFILKLLSTGFEGKCINLDLLTYAADLTHLSSIENDPRYIFKQGDINNQALIDHLIGEHSIDCIIHFAAESHVDRSIESASAFIHTNVTGTHSLLESVKNHPHIHFHHVSTDEVYGSLGPHGTFTENSPIAPNSPYSASKASSDLLVNAYATTYKISTCISRCSNNYGPRQHEEKLIPKTIKNCINHQSIPVYDKGLNVRDWIYVDDHVEALLLLLQKGKRGEVYNIGGENEWTNLDLIHQLIRVLTRATDNSKELMESLITLVKDRPGHDFRYSISNEKMRKEFGWAPKFSFENGLTRTVEWYLSNFHHNLRK